MLNYLDHLLLTYFDDNVTTWMRPRNHVLAGGPDPPMVRGKFEGAVGGPLSGIGKLCCELCKNG